MKNNKILRIPIFILFGLIISFQTAVSPAATYVDALGRTVTLDAPPKRIVAMAPSLTEILYSLGLGDYVVGVTQFSYYPPEASQKAKIGSYVRLNVEKIISLRTDLAIGTADGNKEGVVRLLEQASIPVYIVNPRNVSDVAHTIRAVGEVCGAGIKARELSNKLSRRVNHISEKTASLKRPLVFLQINLKPIMTVNKDTFHNDIIRLAGGENLAVNEPFTYPRINIEEVIRRRPDIIIISSMERGGEFERARKSWLKWPSIPAVKNGRIYLIDSDLLDRASPRIVEGLETMAGLIHPEIKNPGPKDQALVCP